MTPPAYPGGARFAFTVFDDADNATVANSAAVYELLAKHGILTTKSVWVYPPRGQFTGESLLDPGYRDWVLGLQAQGFEIGLHNVGDGAFGRDEILRGLDIFKDTLGAYPRAHANHVSNPDCIYWWDRRFEWPLSLLYRLAYRLLHGRLSRQAGDDPGSPHFWGDAFKSHVDYIRNLTFNGIDTLAHDPRMPYRVKSKDAFSNLWFSSSDGQRIEEMRDLLSKANVDALEASGGACIVYTHFASGFVDTAGHVDPTFEQQVAYLASRSGWFVPVSTLLDYLAAAHASTTDPGYAYRFARNVRWAIDRVRKRRRYGR
jgi:hypothetical protein